MSELVLFLHLVDLYKMSWFTDQVFYTIHSITWGGVRKMDLFELNREKNLVKNMPLVVRMRLKTIDEIVWQGYISNG